MVELADIAHSHAPKFQVFGFMAITWSLTALGTILLGASGRGPIESVCVRVGPGGMLDLCDVTAVMVYAFIFD